MAFYQLQRTQHVHASIDAVWDFISAPSNLKRITPPYMGFEVTGGTGEGRMYPGMIITYQVKPLLGINMSWMTEITHVHEGRYFVDEQRQGPYALWHHQHHLEPVADGVLMRDIVTYVPPMGFVGAIANKLFIARQLNEIFDYREKAVLKYFPPVESK